MVDGGLGNEVGSSSGVDAADGGVAVPPDGKDVASPLLFTFPRRGVTVLQRSREVEGFDDGAGFGFGPDRDGAALVA